MNLLRELVTNYRDTYRLRRRYYIITSIVGLLGSGVGLLAWVAVMKIYTAAIDVSLTMPILKQSPAIILAVAVVFFLFPVFIYFGCILVAGIFAAIMVAQGSMSKNEAVSYALLSKYPSHWFKTNA